MMNWNTGMRVENLALKKRELFNPKKKTNIESTASMLDIVSAGMPQMNKELINTRKTTWRNLSKLGDRHSWEHTKKEDKNNTNGCHATNDQSESTMGVTNRGIELGRMIKLLGLQCRVMPGETVFGVGQ